MLYGMSRRGPVVYFADLGIGQGKYAGRAIACGRIPKRMDALTEWDVKMLWLWTKRHRTSPLNGRRTSGLGVCRDRLRRLTLR